MKSLFVALLFFFTSYVYGQSLNKPDSITLEQNVEIKAEKIRRALSQGADFCTMALWYSKDPTKDDCGFMKNIKLAEMYPQWSRIVAKLKEKETSEVFYTSFGLHIVRVISIRDDYYTVQQILIN